MKKIKDKIISGFNNIEASFQAEYRKSADNLVSIDDPVSMSLQR